MDKLQEYLKSLNPKKEDQAILIYGSKYKVYHQGQFLGVGTWTKDENVGDSFQQIIDPKEPLHVKVLIGDSWELVINSVTF